MACKWPFAVYSHIELENAMVCRIPFVSDYSMAYKRPTNGL